jgi:hypothetical protein
VTAEIGIAERAEAVMDGDDDNIAPFRQRSAVV